MIRKWIKVDGTEQDLSFRMRMDTAAAIIGADEVVMTVMPDRAHVIIYRTPRTATDQARNPRASAMAGVDVSGDAIIAPDADFERTRKWPTT